MSQKQPSNVTQTSKVELSPEQKQVFQLALPSINAAAASDPQIYSGQTVAGFTPAETSAQQQLLTAAGGTVNTLAQQGAGAQGFLLDPAMLSYDSNPYLKSYGQAITSDLTKNLMENILPGINRQSEVTQGPYGSTSRLGIAQGAAIQGTQKSAADALSKLAYDSYANGLSNMTKGLALNPQTMVSQLLGGQVTSAVGEQQRAMEQANLDAEAQKFYLQQQLPFLKAQDIMGLISGMPGATGTSTVSGAMPQKSLAGGLLGGAASGAAIGSAIPGIGTGIGAGLGALLSLL